MGRRKIKIERITDERSRNVTYLKRKMGVVKKAIELSILCGVDIGLVIYDPEKQKVVQYTSNGNIDDIIQKFGEYKALNKKIESRTNADYQTLAKQTERPKGKKKRKREDEYDGQEIGEMMYQNQNPYPPQAEMVQYSNNWNIPNIQQMNYNVRYP